MTLTEYLANSSQRALAEALGIHQSMVSQWAQGVRPVSPERCVDIERATAGKVSRRDLRPDDWARIWPELAARRAPKRQLAAQ